MTSHSEVLWFDMDCDECHCGYPADMVYIGPDGTQCHKPWEEEVVKAMCRKHWHGDVNEDARKDALVGAGRPCLACDTPMRPIKKKWDREPQYRCTNCRADAHDEDFGR